MKTKILILILIPFLSGCMAARIKPGHAMASTGDGATAQFVQSQDPKMPSTQTVETDTTISRVVPTSDTSPTTLPGPVTIPAAASRPAVTDQGVSLGSVTARAVTVPAPVIETTTTHRKITTSIGASQPNTAAEIAAKLASVRWLQWLGVLLALFGGATLVYPPLKLIVNSVTTSAWCIAGGVAMILAPLIIVGHEVLILAMTAGIVGLWFFAHRHGAAQSELATLKKVFVGEPPASPPK